MCKHAWNVVAIAKILNICIKGSTTQMKQIIAS